MASQFSLGTMRFDFSPGEKGARRPRESDDPFNLAILGDFSGRANRAIDEPVSTRATLKIDTDNFAKVMGALNLRLELQIPGTTPEKISLKFQSMEDFHPDQLAKQIPSLSVLVEKRKLLLNPATAAAAETEVRNLLRVQDAPAATTPTQSSAQSSGSSESDADTLGRLLGGGGGSKPAVAPPSGAAAKIGAVQELIRGIVGSSAVPAASAQQSAILSALDLELASRMRALLHHPDFQALEATWRSLDLLVREFGGEENLKLFIVDLSQPELTKDLGANEDLASSGLAKFWSRQPDDKRFTLGLGLYTFTGSIADLETLGRLAKIVGSTRTPYFAAASPRIAGCDTFEGHTYPEDWTRSLAPDALMVWEAVRKLPEAGFIGLALPRFLLRQPYGRASDQIESFPFEEMGAVPVHEEYLWGNPAVLCGKVLAGAFAAEGWEFQPSGWGEVGELPVHKFQKDGESEVKPGAEVWLSERAAEALSAKGLIPIVSIKGRDSVRVAGLQSLNGKGFSIS